MLAESIPLYRFLSSCCYCLLFNDDICVTFLLGYLLYGCVFTSIDFQNQCNAEPKTSFAHNLKNYGFLRKTAHDLKGETTKFSSKYKKNELGIQPHELMNQKR